MKALVYTDTQKSVFMDVEEPQAEAGQCVVELSHCGICGSDMHAWHGHDARRVPPLVLGHEAVGIVSTGELAGKRVAINPLMTCGTCIACTSGQEHLCASRELIGMRVPGAFAERVAISQGNLSLLPDHLAFDQASLAEPLAVAVHSVDMGMAHLRQAPEDAKVIILGGGAIGLLCALVCQYSKIGDIHIAEPNALRRKVLEKSCNAKTYDPISGAPEITQADMVIDAVGSGRTRAAASALTSPGGIIVHVGLQDNEPGLDTRRLTLQEIIFIGTYCYRNNDFAKALSLLADGHVTREHWSEIRPLSEGANGFEDIHNGKALPKTILEI